MIRILDGRKVADSLEEEAKKQVEKINKKGIVPTLAILLIGGDDASKIYVGKKKEAGERMGVNVSVFEYKEGASEQEIISQINKLNNDKNIHGIVVQFPLPEELNEQKIIESVSPKKDVDGFHPLNWGRLAYKTAEMPPCTPASVMRILHYYDIQIESKEVVMVGKSEIVGKPLGILFMNENATLTVVHKKTNNLKEHTERADILISATGHPNLITKDMVKKGAVVIDVGITRKDDKIIGDVDFKNVSKVASAITPVPGGVGPVTVAQLLKNVVKNACL